MTLEFTDFYLTIALHLGKLRELCCAASSGWALSGHDDRCAPRAVMKQCPPALPATVIWLLIRLLVLQTNMP